MSLIAYDATASGNTPLSTTLTFSHTCTGSDRILFVGIDTAGGPDVVTSVTYNGVALTRINTQQTAGTGNRRSYLYYLPAPTTGTNNIVITVSSSITIRGTSASYINALQSGIPDSSTTNSGSPVSSITTSSTTVADNSWVVSVITNTQGVPTAGAGLTIRSTETSTGIGDSNGPKTPAGSYSITWNIPTAGDIAVCQASFAPTVGSASASPSLSPSSSPSASASGSTSPSASLSPSGSLSPSSSESPSVSPSASLSPSGSQSPSPSASLSPSASGSFSGSASGSASSSSSPSASQSPSASGSLSQSPSGSLSPSASGSFSASASGSKSASASQSPSSSVSASASPSLPDHILSVDFVEICYATGYSDKYSNQATRYDSNLYVTQNTTFTDEYGEPC